MNLLALAPGQCKGYLVHDTVLYDYSRQHEELRYFDYYPLLEHSEYIIWSVSLSVAHHSRSTVCIRQVETYKLLVGGEISKTQKNIAIFKNTNDFTIY